MKQRPTDSLPIPSPTQCTQITDSSTYPRRQNSSSVETVTLHIINTKNKDTTINASPGSQSQRTDYTHALTCTTHSNKTQHHPYTLNKQSDTLKRRSYRSPTTSSSNDSIVPLWAKSKSIDNSRKINQHKWKLTNFPLNPISRCQMVSVSVIKPHSSIPIPRNFSTLPYPKPPEGSRAYNQKNMTITQKLTRTMAKTSQETHQPSTHNQQHPKSIFLTRSIRKEHNRTLLKTFAHCKITRGQWTNEISPISETEKLV